MKRIKNRILIFESLVLFLFMNISLFSTVNQKDLDYFNNAIGKREEIFYLISDDYEGNKMCEYILRNIVMDSISEKLEKYIAKNKLENEVTFYNLLDLFEKYNNEIYSQALEFMSIYDDEGAEVYGANNYLLKQYFDKNCYQPSDKLLKKIENLIN
ncbi:hypothetical protein [Leptotrichia wadei]|mgnify:CR=1|jgi:hypothetical protein|uniref:hypothetical protein n=1 Tax=Leptotrichia wadei TaxID=157687 RepID=UPI0028EBFF16|nr:hypothetical protein [Leptotrichia wadei]